MNYVDIASMVCAHCEDDNPNGRAAYLDAVNLFLRMSGVNPVAIFFKGDTGASEDTLEAADTLVRAYVSNEFSPVGEITYTTYGNHDSGKGNFDWADESYKSSFQLNKPFPIILGTGKDGYKIEIGNVTHLFLGDRNDLETPLGRLNEPSPTGGMPSGANTDTQQAWLISEAALNTNCMVHCHHAPLDTVFETCDGCGSDYHGPSGVSNHRGNISSVLNTANGTFVDGSTWIVDDVFPNIIGWDGGHTHALVDYVDQAGKGWFELVNGTPVWKGGFNTVHFLRPTHSPNPWFVIMRFYEGESNYDIIPVDVLTGTLMLDYKQCMPLDVPFVMPSNYVDNSGLLINQNTVANDWVAYDPYNRLTINNSVTVNVNSAPNTFWGETELVGVKSRRVGQLNFQATYEFDGNQPSAMGITGDKYLARYNRDQVQLLRAGTREVIWQANVDVNSGDILRIKATNNKVFFQKRLTGKWINLKSRNTNLGFFKRPVIQSRRTSGAAGNSTSIFSNIYVSTTGYRGVSPV